MRTQAKVSRVNAEVSRPLVLGHRGASSEAPENTIAAFALAAARGADGVELDVRRTSDRALVVHHDAEVAGVGLIVDVEFAALRAARPGIPTFAETLDACEGMRLVNVELKCCAWEPDADPERIVARGVAAEIAARGAYATTVVSSFDLAMIDDVRTFDPAIDTGWLIHGQDPQPLVAKAQARGHAWLHPDWGLLDANLDATVAAARDAGIRLDTWTVDDPDAIRRFATAGVDAIITNDIRNALTALA
jgi:glycerophosphoryl diester phosphodiesterase